MQPPDPPHLPARPAAARRYVDARGDAALQRLRALAHSPAAWFRCPLVQLVLVSCGEYEDYKKDLRLRLRAMADTESSAPSQPELLFAYVRPPGLEAGAKGPARVFDAMRRDLNRRRERCVRLDPAAPAAAEAGQPGAPGSVRGWAQRLEQPLQAAGCAVERRAWVAADAGAPGTDPPAPPPCPSL